MATKGKAIKILFKSQQLTKKVYSTNELTNGYFLLR